MTLKMKINEDELIKDLKYLILKNVFGKQSEINLDFYKILWIPKK